MNAAMARPESSHAIVDVSGGYASGSGLCIRLNMCKVSSAALTFSKWMQSFMKL